MSMLLKTEDMHSLREVHLVEIDGQYMVLYRNTTSHMSNAMDQETALCVYQGVVMDIAMGETDEQIIMRLQ